MHAHNTTPSAAGQVSAAPGTMADTTPSTQASAARYGLELATIEPTPQQIKQARELSGLTLAQAAAMVHVEERAWRRWELGERGISGACWELFLIKTLGLLLRK